MIKGLLGLRAQLFILEGKFASPVHQDFIWDQNGLAVAQCKFCKDDLPRPECTCGIFASTNQEVAKIYTSTGPSAIVLIEACGKRQRYTDGWRSEQGYIVAIVNVPFKAWYGREFGEHEQATWAACQYWHKPLITLATAQDLIALNWEQHQ